MTAAHAVEPAVNGLTDSNEISQGQATALAALLAELRPEWKARSILSMLWQNRSDHPFAELAVAAVRCAVVRSNETPAMIFLDGPHWRAPVAAKPGAPVSASGQDMSPECETHPGTKAWECRYCGKDKKPMPPNFRAMVEASRNQPSESEI